jgi:RNA polymerase primary sigma factor
MGHSFAISAKVKTFRFTANRPLVSPLADYVREIGETPLLTLEQEKQLGLRIVKGDVEARDHLARAHLRLVVKIARAYRCRGLDLQDLVAEGNLGLLRAAERFDPTLGTRFSTYASSWIRQSIRRAILRTAGPVRIPDHANELLVKWRRGRVQLQAELGRTPTPEETAASLELSDTELTLIKKAICINGAPWQIDAEDHALWMAETLPDRNSRPPDSHLIDSDDVKRALELLGRLDKRHATVLRLRFGLSGKDPQTLRSIGNQLGLTAERVRQMQATALAKLRRRLKAD